METVTMTITLDHAAGVAEMRKRDWAQRVEIAALPDWLRLYRELWARGQKDPKQPGPWARFYEDDVRAIEAAVRECQNAQR